MNRAQRLRRRACVGSTAQTADFFAADEGRAPALLLLPTQRDSKTGKAAVYAPGDQPNPRNPGSISDNEVKRLAAVAAAKAAQKVLDANLAATKKADAARIAKQQADNAAAQLKKDGGYLGQFVTLTKQVAPAVAAVAAVAATGGLAAGAVGLAGLAGSLGAVATGATQLSSGLRASGGVAQTVKTGDPIALVRAGVSVATQYAPDTANAVKSSLAVPGLAQGVKSSVDAVKATADRIVAAAEAGVPKATEIYAATKALALAGDVNAIAAVGILADTVKARARAAVPLGQPQPLSAKGTAALAAFPVLMANASLAPPKAAAPPAPIKATPKAPAAAPQPAAVTGLLIENDGPRTGRLNFSASAWRPCAAGAPGALRGLVVTPAGRLALDTDWIAA